MLCYIRPNGEHLPMITQILLGIAPDLTIYFERSISILAGHPDLTTFTFLTKTS